MALTLMLSRVRDAIGLVFSERTKALVAQNHDGGFGEVQVGDGDGVRGQVGGSDEVAGSLQVLEAGRRAVPHLQGGGFVIPGNLQSVIQSAELWVRNLKSQLCPETAV